MNVKLVCVIPGVPANEIAVGSLPAVLGRSPNADVRVDDRWASRIHCEIRETSGVLSVDDLNSSHGTLVNGQPVTNANLMPGDRLTVGLTTFQVEYKHGRESRSAAVRPDMASRSRRHPHLFRFARTGRRLPQEAR